MKQLLVTDIMVNKNEAYDVKVPKAVFTNDRMLREYLRQELLLMRDITFGYQTIPLSCYSTEDNIRNDSGLDLSFADHYDGWINIKVQPLIKNTMVMHYTDKDLRVLDNDVDSIVYHELIERLEADFLIIDQEEAVIND